MDAQKIPLGWPEKRRIGKHDGHRSDDDCWCYQCDISAGEEEFTGCSNETFNAAIDACLAVHLQEKAEWETYKTQLEAWQDAFGTTQLTHALDRLAEAERKADFVLRKPWTCEENAEYRMHVLTVLKKYMPNVGQKSYERIKDCQHEIVNWRAK